MRTVVYIDGFNLYYRALRESRHKWLNLHALCEAALPQTCDIVAIIDPAHNHRTYAA